jgi:hypothetical protein
MDVYTAAHRAAIWHLRLRYGKPFNGAYGMGEDAAQPFHDWYAQHFHTLVRLGLY